MAETEERALVASRTRRSARRPELAPTNVAQPQPIAVDCETAAAMLGNISRTTFLERVTRGELPKPRKIGTRSLWLIEELQAAARALPVTDERPLPKHP